MFTKILPVCIAASLALTGCNQKEETPPTAAAKTTTEKYRCGSPEVLESTVKLVAGPLGTNLLELAAPEPVAQIETTRRCRAILRLKKAYFNDARYTEFANESIARDTNLTFLQTGFDLQYSFTPSTEGYALRAELGDGDTAHLKALSEKYGNFQKFSVNIKEREQEITEMAERQKDLEALGLDPNRASFSLYKPGLQINYPFSPPSKDAIGRPCTEVLSPEELAALQISQPTCLVRYFDDTPAIAEEFRLGFKKEQLQSVRISLLGSKKRIDMKINVSEFYGTCGIAIGGSNLRSLPAALKDDIRYFCQKH
jgi:hypothetical protein